MTVIIVLINLISTAIDPLMSLCHVNVNRIFFKHFGQLIKLGPLERLVFRKRIIFRKQVSPMCLWFLGGSKKLNSELSSLKLE